MNIVNKNSETYPESCSLKILPLTCPETVIKAARNNSMTKKLTSRSD